MTLGKGFGFEVFEGDEDWPFPKSATIMMKYYTTPLSGEIIIRFAVETCLIRVQSFVFSDEPDIVRYYWSRTSANGAFEDTRCPTSRIPSWIYDSRGLRVAISFIRNMCVGDRFGAL